MMSSEQPQQPPAIDPDTPMTVGMFQTAMKNIGDEIKKALSDRDDAAQKQNEQNQARLNEFANALHDVVSYVKRPSTATEGIASGIDKTSIVSQLIDRAINHLSGAEQSEVDQIAQVLAKGMMREVVLEGKKRARIGLKKGTILPEEVEGIIEDKIEKAARLSHGPGV